MNLQQLRYLCAIADHGLNVSDAAEALYTSQPGISKQIRQLEEEIGAALFDRLPTGLMLTPVGEALARHIITVLGRKLTSIQISRVAAVCAEHGLNIDVITRLTGRMSLRDPVAAPKQCIQLATSGSLADERNLRDQLWQIADA